MKQDKYFLAVLAIVTAARVYYSGLIELSLDEPYYWIWSHHLQMSYYDHPPMVAYFLWIAGLFGESERWIRLPAVLAGSGVTWIAYRMASDIFDSRCAGWGSAILLNFTPMFAIGGLLTTPDTPLCLFWAASLYYGYRLIDSQNPEYWYKLGLMVGFAMLSKYTAMFFAPAFLLFLLLSDENRHWLLRKEPYVAFLLSMIVFAPVIIWNQRHDWISLKFQFTHGFVREGWSHFVADFLEFWGGQAGVMGGVLFIFIIIAAVGIGKMGVRRERDDYLYLSVMSVPILLFFVANSLRVRMELNWSVIGYISAIIATPGFIMQYADELRDGKDWALKIVFGLSVALAGAVVIFAHVELVDPIYPMPQRIEVSRRFYGWNQLGGETGKVLASLDKGSFIVCERYQIASLMRYYIPGHPEAYIIDGAGRFGYYGSLDHLTGQDAVYVAENDRVNLQRLTPYFDQIIHAGTVRIERHGELARVFELYTLRNYHGGLIKT